MYDTIAIIYSVGNIVANLTFIISVIVMSALVAKSRRGLSVAVAPIRNTATIGMIAALINILIFALVYSGLAGFLPADYRAATVEVVSMVLFAIAGLTAPILFETSSKRVKNATLAVIFGWVGVLAAIAPLEAFLTPLFSGIYSMLS